MLKLFAVLPIMMWTGIETGLGQLGHVLSGSYPVEKLSWSDLDWIT